MPAMFAEELSEAACTLSDDTGFGWDRWHPKVVCRLSLELLQLLVVILLECERTGCRPERIALVLIALLENATILIEGNHGIGSATDEKNGHLGRGESVEPIEGAFPSAHPGIVDFIGGESLRPETA